MLGFPPHEHQYPVGNTLMYAYEHHHSRGMECYKKVQNFYRPVSPHMNISIPLAILTCTLMDIVVPAGILV